MTAAHKGRATAIVIGASITGCLAARVLKPHFDRVILVDKDSLPDVAEPRAYVQQEHHVHLLLQRGSRNIEMLFPGFLAELEAAGAEVVDLSHGIKWHLAGRWKNRWPTGIFAHYCSRTLVEHHLRRRTLSLAGVELLQRSIVQEPVWDAAGARIVGIRIADSFGEERTIAADFVLDASGRGSLTSGWLSEKGYDEPEYEHVVSHLGYASRIYRRNPEFQQKWDVLLVTPQLPEAPRMGVISPIEGDRWMVTAGGWLGQFPEATEESFLSFMQKLPVPDIYNVLMKAEPLSEVRRFKLSGGLRRRYDKLSRFPAGFFVLGDAVCSLNPIYSQGMSVASIQVLAFSQHLAAHLAGQMSARDLFEKTVAATDQPWDQARSGDELLPEVRGVSARRNRWRDAYFNALVQSSINDRTATLALLKANNLIADMQSLTTPKIACLTLKNAAMRRLGLQLP